MNYRPTARVESLGSVWLFDEHASVYCRMPKTEGPRQSPPGEDWGGAGAGSLQDLHWHPFISWSIRDKAVWTVDAEGNQHATRPPVLVIVTGEHDGHIVVAPQAERL